MAGQNDPILRWWHDNVFDLGIFDDGREDENRRRAQEELSGLGVYTDPLSEEEWNARNAELLPRLEANTAPRGPALIRGGIESGIAGGYDPYAQRVEAANREAGFAPQPDLDNLYTALGRYNDIFEGGGYTESERAQMRQAQMESANFEQSQREAQLQQMAMRGMSGSGLEALSRNMSAQEGANRASASADQIAIAGQNRTMQALGGYTGVAGGIQGAQSATDQFNAQTAQAGMLARAGQDVTFAQMNQQQNQALLNAVAGAATSAATSNKGNTQPSQPTAAVPAAPRDDEEDPFTVRY